MKMMKISLENKDYIDFSVFNY